MITSCGSNGFYIVNKQCMYDGKRISNPPKFNTKHINLTTIDDKIYLNGYQYFPKQDKWRRTLKAVWYLISNYLF